MFTKQNKDVLIMAGAIFALFFGAGNLIFPPALGAKLGTDWLTGALGFCLATNLLSFLSMVAVSRSGSGLKDLARHIQPTVQACLGIVMILAMGPLLAIPRTGATTLEMGIQPLLPESFPVNSWAVTGLYFLGVLFFSISRQGIMDKIGKLFTPFLVVSLCLIIFKALADPLGESLPGHLPQSFAYAFVEGYQTLDPVGGIIVTIIALNAITEKGYTDRKIRNSILRKSAAISSLGLIFIYTGLLFFFSTGESAVSEGLSRTGYFVALVEKLLGPVGTYSLSVAVTFACFTTAIGLTSTSGLYFERLTKGKLKYRTTVILVVISSFLLANLGVDQIVQFSAPLLLLIYPAIITLIFLNLGSKRINSRHTHQFAFYTALAFGVFSVLPVLGLDEIISCDWLHAIPLDSYGFSWTMPTAAMGVLGNMLDSFLEKRTERSLPVS